MKTLQWATAMELSFQDRATVQVLFALDCPTPVLILDMLSHYCCNCSIRCGWHDHRALYFYYKYAR